MRWKDDDGQAIVLVAVAASFFLIGAIGLGIDGSHLYAQRQMAQAAADSGAIAGIMSIFDGTYSTGGTAFPLTTFTCGTTDARTPCAYVSKNGFGTSASDTVTIDYPSTAPGVSLASGVPANLLRVTVSRQVKTTILRMLGIVGGGASVSTVKATATAAIVSVASPIPILVTHPTLSGAFSMSGNPAVTICGGPHRSVQVNSTSSTASTSNGAKATINLSHAGPPDPGNCTTGAGADFGATGGPSSEPFGTFTVGNGSYVTKASPIKDPLASVAEPGPPIPTGWPTITPPTTKYVAGATVPGGGTCPTSAGSAGCTLWKPGVYNGGIAISGTTALMQPGIYYINGPATSGSAKGAALYCHSNCNMQMATGFTDTTTGTGWTGNVMFYSTGSGSPAAAGAFNLTANGTINLVGAPTTSPYKGILLFQDRNSQGNNTPSKNPHQIGGGGAMQLQGTIYLNNTTMTSSQYQELDLSGGSGSGTTIQGEIIVGVLALGGNGSITMNLNSTPAYTVNQIALVN
ncbi:MAG: hypothetical protein JSS95_02565 [Acidobacteria bacterium]|nr:hypothetical protein [Acidobacteriota bacterium]